MGNASPPAVQSVPSLCWTQRKWVKADCCQPLPSILDAIGNGWNWWYKEASFAYTPQTTFPVVTVKGTGLGGYFFSP